MNWLTFILGCLATHRLSLLVSKEDGPAWVFRKLRRLPPARSSARKGLSCPLCLSVYFSAIVTTFFWQTNRITGTDWPLFWLAFSSAAICLHMKFTRDV